MVVGLTLLGLAALAVLILLVDPFGWHLLDKASGLRDEAAGAMPPDVGLYAGLDLVNFSEERLTEFGQPFVTALAEPGVDDLAGGLARLDALLAEEIGLTLSDDVMPWLGRSVGLGLTELALMPDGSIDRLGWLLVAGSQDRQAADAFLARLSQQLAQAGGAEARLEEYRGRTITSFGPDPALPLGGLAFSRSGGQVILASDAATVRAAIDAQRGESLADSQTFRDLTASLPAERGLTLYADQARLPMLGRLLASAAPLAIGPLDLASLTLPPGAIGVSIVDQGLRLDTAGVAAGAGDAAGAREMVAGLPADTLALLAGGSLDDGWQSLKGSLAAGGNLADFEESMALLGREFGYDPDQRLLPLLDGEWALVLLPAGEGLLLELADRPLGLVLLAGSQDRAALADSLAGLSQGLSDQRLPLATVDVAGTTATTVDLASLIGAPLPYYGQAEDVFFLGTDAQILGQALAADEPLAGDPGFQAALELLPADQQLTAYVDAARLGPLAFGGADDGDEVLVGRLLAPVQQVIAASGPAADGVRPGVVYLLIQ